MSVFIWLGAVNQQHPIFFSANLSVSGSISKFLHIFAPPSDKNRATCDWNPHVPRRHEGQAGKVIISGRVLRVWRSPIFTNHASLRSGFKGFHQPKGWIKKTSYDQDFSTQLAAAS